MEYNNSIPTYGDTVARGGHTCDAKGNNAEATKTSEHRANVACFLQDVNSGIIYGLTNRHFTIYASETVHIKTSHNCNIPLGKPHNIVSEQCLDIGLIEVRDDIKHLVRNQVIQTGRNTSCQQVSLYSGTFQDIFEKDVYKYKPNQTGYEVSSYNTATTGIIASKYEHGGILEESTMQFLIKDKQCKFSTAGESGTSVAIQTQEKDKIELIGMICGAFQEFTICMYLPSVLQYYNTCGMCLRFLCTNSEDDSTSYSKIVSTITSGDIHYNIIPCGIAIFLIYTTPEQIAPKSFDLVEYSIYLLGLKFSSVELKSYRTLLDKERKMRELVNQRLTANTSLVFENDTPQYVVSERSLLACHCLYENNLVQAEHYLKDAILCIPKAKDMGLRLLCKLITYITWYCLSVRTTESLKKMKELLEEGLEEFDDLRCLNGFPVEVIGYMYFDYSRYYLTMYDNNIITRGNSQKQSEYELDYRKAAVEKARQYVQEFRKNYKEPMKSEEFLVRLTMVECNLAYALLGCCHDFSGIANDIPLEDITEAEHILEDLKLNITEAPMVQKSKYYIAKCDLKLRKGLNNKALKIARHCKHLLEQNTKMYAEAIQQVHFRLKYLSTCVYQK